MAAFFPDLLDVFVTPAFLEGVREKFHYGKEQAQELREVAEEMQPLMCREAFWERKESVSGSSCRTEAGDWMDGSASDRDRADGNSKDGNKAYKNKADEYKADEYKADESKEDENKEDENADRDREDEAAGNAGAIYETVVMSLGAGLDKLQENYNRRGRLSESYMMEALSGELLLWGYGAYNRYVQLNTVWHVARYHFLGSGEKFPLEMLPQMLKGLAPRITCNAAYCMSPKKSVVFVAELTQDAGIRCEGICAGCSRTCCPNRMENGQGTGQAVYGMDLALNYGYRRIFGKQGRNRD